MLGHRDDATLKRLLDKIGLNWLIDHGLALRSGLLPDTLIENKLLDVARGERDELALQRLKRELIGLASSYRSEDVTMAGQQIPLAPVGELADFLTARLEHLTGLAQQRLHARQRDLD